MFNGDLKSDKNIDIFYAYLVRRIWFHMSYLQLPLEVSKSATQTFIKLYPTIIPSGFPHHTFNLTGLQFWLGDVFQCLFRLFFILNFLFPTVQISSSSVKGKVQYHNQGDSHVNPSRIDFILNSIFFLSLDNQVFSILV